MPTRWSGAIATDRAIGHFVPSTVPVWITILRRLCAARGARLELEPEFGYAGRLIAADGRLFTFKGTSIDINGAGAAALARDKSYAAFFLRDAGLTVPRGVLVHAARRQAAFELKNPDIARRLAGPGAASDFARTVGYPLFVKPNEGSEGDGVVRVDDGGRLTTALADLFLLHDRVLVQEAVEGADLRVIVLEGTVKAAFLRRPLTIVGTGSDSISDLLAVRLASFSEGGHGARIAPEDPRIVTHLSSCGLALADVPDAGAEVACLANANLSTGGTAVDVSNFVSSSLAGIAIRAARSVGLRFAGVDLMVEGALNNAEEAVVLEVNAAPGLSYFHRLGGAAAMRVERIYADLLDAMLAG